MVSFTCLKAFAFDQRAERKDAHDLVYCLEHAEADIDAIVGQFLNAQATRHRDTIGEALGILARHFCDDETGEGYRKDGPVAVARFEADTDDEGDRDRRVLRQRQASDIVGRLVSRLKMSPS